MSRLIALSLLVYTACGTSEAATTSPSTPAKAQPASTAAADDLQSVCVASFTHDRTCTAEYIPSLVDTRAKIDMPPGIAEQVKADRAGVIAKANEEWAQDSTDANIAMHCTQMTSHMTDAAKGMADAVRACNAKTACAEFVACMAPIEEQLMLHGPKRD